ncbi:MAG: putative glycoside hydrolase, partial [Patescibacteria group bacterium]
MNKCRLPIDCVLAITYNCNARCVMCDIWKIKGFPELPVAEFAKLPSTLRDINISGGEPFLRADLPEIVAIVAKTCPKARIVISTNGFLTDLAVKQMKKILKIKPDIGVAVSIDGMDEMHDEMRGIPGGFRKDMETIRQLKELGMTNIRLGFTITEKNIKHLKKVYDLSRRLGAQFTHSFAQSSEFYFGGKTNTDFQGLGDESLTEGMALATEDSNHVSGLLRELLRQEYSYIIKSELRSWNLKRWARAYFAFGMYKFITSRNPVVSNAPGRDFFFLDPNGVIYPSVVHNFQMGDIKQLPIIDEQFWCSQETDLVREKIYKSKIPVWMICTARTAIKKHPFKVLAWIIKNKFFKKNILAALILAAVFYSAVLFPLAAAGRVSPKRANYYLNWEILPSKISELARWDLLILDMETQINSLAALKKIKQLNPNIILLAYITPQEIKKDAASSASVMRRRLASGIDESWYLTDTQNNKITFWPGTWMLNVADNAPEINGVRLNKYIAAFVAREILSAGVWDGVFYDNAWKDVKWLTGDTVDLDKDRQKDDNIDVHWREGMRAIYDETRRLINNKYLLVGNATSDVYKDNLNGIMLESFPVLGWKESMRVYAGNQEGIPQPRINIINANTGNKGNSNDFKKIRFSLASALLLDGLYSFDFGDKAHAQTWWYDEYDIELGKPIIAAVALNNKAQFEEDVWRREYENGIALANPTSQSQDVDLGGEYEKIKGVQDSAVNDGSIVNRVNLQANDGLVMLRTFQTLKNIVFANGNFIRFFDKNGNRVRNGLFIYENGVPGGAKIYHGDLDGNGAEEKIIATGQKLEIFNSTGGVWFSDWPFGRNYQGDLRVVVGKLSGSLENSIVISQNKDGQAVIYNYHGALIKDRIFPLGKKYSSGLAMAIAEDKNKNIKIIVGAGGGKLPEIIIYNNSLSKVSKRFFVDNKKLKGSLSVASGDINGDGAPEIIVALDFGKTKQIK